MPLQFGPQFCDDSSVTFHVHAPAAESVGLVWDGEDRVWPMSRSDDGGFQLNTVPSAADACYWFQFADGRRYPDPASRFQPRGVHGPSQLVDSRGFAWTDADWQGVAKQDLIVYELHIGTFTSAGTFVAAIERLDEVAELGVTAIEIMPVAQAAGQWNWGYDGVNFFAPSHTYGTADDLRRLVDAAHAKGLAVILDVVYNHFGPEGNYLHPFGGYVSETHSTPWGDAPNFDGPHSQVAREFVLANVRYWLQEFHMDGLRLDATHCIPDQSPRHIVLDIGRTCSELQQLLKRELHLIAESNVYDQELLIPPAGQQHGCDALWCDDFLHSAFAQLKPGEHRSSRQYVPGDDLQTVLQRGYVFAGNFSMRYSRVSLQEDNRQAELKSLISSIQHHDFIGNHPGGQRLHQLISESAHRSAAALMLLFPSAPMLFMGEEFACDSPFYFFVDFGDEHLRQAVEQGRRDEHPQHTWHDAESPLSQAAFHRSKLVAASEGISRTLDWYRDLIQLRKQWQATGLLHADSLTARWNPETHTAELRYGAADKEAFALMRLHPADASPAPLTVHVTGSIAISQNCEAVAPDSGQCVLGADAVVVGTGRFRMDT